MRVIRPALLLLVLLLAACGEATDANAAADAPAVVEDTTSAESSSTVEATTSSVATEEAQGNSFSTEVLPILETKCATCHNDPGPGSIHWSLETVGDAVDEAAFLGDYVDAGVMPPWPAGPLSVAFSNDRGLSPEERATLVEWASSGAEIDIDPSTPVRAAEVESLAEVDATLYPEEPYQGSPDVLDDYRCLVYDPQLTEDTWLVGYNFVPDQAEVVHHAIGYRAPASQRERAEAKDAADPGPGWSCYGGSGIGQDELFIGWAPGQVPARYPDGAGLRMAAGDFIVLQIHYHYDLDAPLDNSSLQMDYTSSDEPLKEVQIMPFLGPVEIPCATWQEGPLCDRDAAMAAAIEKYGRAGVRADEANLLCGTRPSDYADMTNGVASSECTLPIYRFGTLVSVLAHQHEIGETFRITLNPDRPNEKILLDIPDWDFDWQFNYAPVEDITLTPGDTLKLECSWDRANQKPGIEPAYIVWADGTYDEMCFATMTVLDD